MLFPSIVVPSLVTVTFERNWEAVRTKRAAARACRPNKFTTCRRRSIIGARSTLLRGLGREQVARLADALFTLSTGLPSDFQQSEILAIPQAHQLDEHGKLVMTDPVFVE
jgi:hypothetical protein